MIKTRVLRHIGLDRCNRDIAVAYRIKVGPRPRVLGCAGTGIRVGNDCLVRDCAVSGSVFGIQTNLGARVIGCNVNDCSLAYNVNGWAVVVDCVAHDNTSLGINANRLAIVSYGEERPEALGSDEASWARNRRAVFVVN